ncbi:glycoside hydrolase family 79 protein [Peniophora sp. CONT]|nr:glycoside hydrolase family 79 protein [Peniophora sp. CONT]
MLLSLAFAALTAVSYAVAAATPPQFTVYHPHDPNVIVGGTTTTSETATSTGPGAAATYTGAAAYDPRTLNPPAPPSPPITTSFPVQLSAGGISGLSIPLSGSFMGFSIEMSIAQQIIGSNSSFLNVPFLNLMSNIVARAGSVVIRVGGNTQENAVLVNELPNGTIIRKDTSVKGTPTIDYTSDLMQMMANVSQLLNAWWYLGIPFFNTSPFDLSIAEKGQAILGDRLLALQAANEPDLYNKHGHRDQNYSPSSYMSEVGTLIDQTSNNADVPRKDDLWLVASSSTGEYNENVWSPSAIWGTGIVDNFEKQLNALTVQRYPNNNCAAVYGTGTPVVPQDVFADYLTHTGVVSLAAQYIPSSQVALSHGKPLIMFETNSASCSGFVGISDAFASALWGLDWGLQLAATNFSGALFHVGGQGAYYNPFTPPPTNQSSFRQWSVGPVYYSALVMAEVLGSSNQSRVADLNMNGGQPLTPGYAIYEGDVPTKVALLNYIDDPSGAQAYTAQISIGGASPSSVRVKRLSASSVSQKGNYTWAGQTFGNNFESDGRLMGDENVDTVQCNNGVCSVTVPAPGFALVFLTDNAFTAIENTPAMTFPTTAVTATVNTARVIPSVLASSNGHHDMTGQWDTTSPGSAHSVFSAAWTTRTLPGYSILLGAIMGAVLLM